MLFYEQKLLKPTTEEANNREGGYKRILRYSSGDNI